MRRFDNKALWSQSNIAGGSINQLANFQFFFFLLFARLLDKY